MVWAGLENPKTGLLASKIGCEATDGWTELRPWAAVLQRFPTLEAQLSGELSSGSPSSPLKSTFSTVAPFLRVAAKFRSAFRRFSNSTR